VRGTDVAQFHTVIDEESWISAFEHHNAKRIVGLEHADQFSEFEDGVWVLEIDGAGC
jgi:hypothetical protein